MVRFRYAYSHDRITTSAAVPSARLHISCVLGASAEYACMFMFCYGHPLAVRCIKLHMCGLIFQQSLTMPMLCHARAIDIGNDAYDAPSATVWSTRNVRPGITKHGLCHLGVSLEMKAVKQKTSKSSSIACLNQQVLPFDNAYQHPIS